VGAVILYPAIDLKEGRCVRLVQGDMAQATVFNDDPAAQARAFKAQGFTHLHVVDLDGAFAGKPMNAAAVEAILASADMPVQLGGGIRDMATVTGWLEKGVARVIIGTAAVRIGVEAAIRQGWDAIIGADGIFVGMHGFGASGPFEELYKHFGITAEAIAEAAAQRLAV
jgi:phosphoribosylformimino-5-aminoimidazole carboxamide ribonucleotide (ProFAR) isomerase